MDLFSLAIAIGIPSAITGFCFWCLEHHMEKREERDKEERKKRAERAGREGTGERKGRAVHHQLHKCLACARRSHSKSGTAYP